MAKILLVEDDMALQATVRQWLVSEHHLVDAVSDAELALEHVRMRKYEIVVLDWQLPGMSGIDFVKIMRQSGMQTPVIMLTGKSDVGDRVGGLDAGADDYLTKPFAIDELMARVRALLRRPPERVGTLLTAGAVSLNTDSRRVTVNGVELRLKPVEYNVLEFFMRNPNRVLSAELLLQNVWKDDAGGSIDSVYVCINRLRKKLGDADIIRTVHGVGYQLIVS